jgi:hypothetical protein
VQVPSIGGMGEAEEADAVWITPGCEGATGRAALRSGGERIGEKEAAMRQAIEVG